MNHFPQKVGLGDQFSAGSFSQGDQHFMSIGASRCIQEEVVDSPDVHFEPLVKLPPMELKTLEEGEEELFKM